MFPGLAHSSFDSDENSFDSLTESESNYKDDSVSARSVLFGTGHDPANPAFVHAESRLTAQDVLLITRDTQE